MLTAKETSSRDYAYHAHGAKAGKVGMLQRAHHAWQKTSITAAGLLTTMQGHGRGAKRGHGRGGRGRGRGRSPASYARGIALGAGPHASAPADAPASMGLDGGARGSLDELAREAVLESRGTLAGAQPHVACKR